MKRLRQRPDRAEFFRFGEDLRCSVRRDQQQRNLRLQLKQIGDDLKSGDIREKQIDDAEPKPQAARLVEPIATVGGKHNFIALRLKHQPERIAY